MSWVHNQMNGSADIVLQTGDVEGGIHFHAPKVKVPRQLPARIKVLHNQIRVLGELDDGTAGRPALDNPLVKVVLGQRGSGKSTVATAWLHDRRADYPDGQLYADLGTTAPREALGEFLVALGVNRADLPPDLDTRAAMFRTMTDSRALGIILDDAVSPAQVRALLPGRGGSVVVATGHGPFGVLRGEATLIKVDPLEDDLAVLLLRPYAGARIDAEPVALRAILDLCDGLPVALLQVGGVLAEQPSLTLAEFLEELTDPDVGLTQVAVADQPTLASLFDLTYRRLTPDAQACYRALSLPTNTVDALAAALGRSARSLKGALRELETMRVVEPAGGRLVVHNVVREHARHVADAVLDAPERAALRDRVIAWYLAGAVAADENVMGQRVWRRKLFPELVVDATHPGGQRDWLEAERGTLRTIVTMAFEQDDFATVVRLCVVLWSLHEPGKYADDLVATNELGVRAARNLGADLVESVLHSQLAFGHIHRGELGAAVESCARAVAAAKRAGDVGAEATAIEAQGLAEFARGEQSKALELLRRNLELASTSGDPRRIALARFHLAKVEPDAVPLLEAALAGFQALPKAEPRNLAKVMTWLGRKGPEGRRFLDEALVLTGDWPFDHAQVLDALGEVTGEHSFYQRALEIYDQHGFIVAAARTRQRSS